MMDARRNGLVLLALLLLTQTTISAQTDSMGKDVPVDSVSVATSDSLQTKRSFFKKFLDYFNDANKEKKNKKFDFSVIGGPHYSSDTKFGLGLVAAGLYRTPFSGRTGRADIRSFPLRMFLFMEMSLLLVFICWE